jgi:branched-chain amino acid transport system ATP-binding protein
LLLEVKDIHISYGDIQAVCGVSFHLEKGELVSIIGANGAGKTSILQGVMGIVPLRNGSVRFNGTDISAMPVHQRARMGMRMVPERSRVFPRLTVYENLLAGVYGLRKKLPVEERIARLYEIFPILKERRDQPGRTLSGGEQQQLAIARALISDPQLLLVDEVSMGLMPKLVDEVFAVLQELNREHGLTILLVEQNAIASLAISARGYVLETGTCALDGTANELMDNPRVKEVYLGH